MRTVVIGTVASLGFAAAALAQSTPAPALPQLFKGYAQSEITPGLCRNVNAGQTDCIIPALSAGRYLVHAAGTSTAQNAEAKQRMIILAGPRNCADLTTRPDPKKPWASGPRTFRVDCELTVVTDKPLTVSARYGDANATKDPKGPVLTVERVAWDGIISTQGQLPSQAPPQPAPAAKK